VPLPHPAARPLLLKLARGGASLAGLAAAAGMRCFAVPRNAV